jgi:hypothetical protein
MVKMLEKRRLILRKPGQPRSLQVLIPDDEIPPWNNRKAANAPARPRDKPSRPAATPAKLYVLSVYLVSGPVSPAFANKPIQRVIEVRGDQTLEDLHQVFFKAYGRSEQHLYESQFGKRPFDPKGPNYGLPEPNARKKTFGDARTTKLDDLDLKPERVFGYWFDFGDDWFHELHVERVEQAILTVDYPRVIKRVGKSPPQR